MLKYFFIKTPAQQPGICYPKFNTSQTLLLLLSITLHTFMFSTNLQAQSKITLIQIKKTACKKAMSQQKNFDYITFLIAFAEKIEANCPYEIKAQFENTLSSTKLKQISSEYMRLCKIRMSAEKKSQNEPYDEFECIKTVNKKMNIVKSLNGYSFGQDKADREQLAKQEQAQNRSLKQFEDMPVNEKEKLFQCAALGHIYYGPDKDILEMMCDQAAPYRESTPPTRPTKRTQTELPASLPSRFQRPPAK